MDATITTVGQTCSNGTATITNPTGGTAPYTYNWSNGAAIYFDFNAPVITNQVFNTIKDAVVATEDAEKIANTANFTIFPKPYTRRY